MYKKIIPIMVTWALLFSQDEELNPKCCVCSTISYNSSPFYFEICFCQIAQAGLNLCYSYLSLWSKLDFQAYTSPGYNLRTCVRHDSKHDQYSYSHNSQFSIWIVVPLPKPTECIKVTGGTRFPGQGMVLKQLCLGIQLVLPLLSLLLCSEFLTWSSV